VVADSLTREAGLSEEVAALQYIQFGLRHLLRLAFEVLDAAGGAFGVGAAAVPFVRPIRSTILTERLLGGRAHATSSLTIQPWVSSEAVELVYRQVQKQVIGGKPGRVSDKNLNLLKFAIERADGKGNLPKGEILVQEWDRRWKQRRSKWCYVANTRRFWRDLRSV
jgi:hypothetical protein